MVTESEKDRKKAIEDWRGDLYSLGLMLAIVDQANSARAQLLNIESLKYCVPEIEPAVERCIGHVTELVSVARKCHKELECAIWEKYSALAEDDSVQSEEIKEARCRELTWVRDTATRKTAYMVARASWVQDARGMLLALPDLAPKSFTESECESLRFVSGELYKIYYDMYERVDEMWKKMDEVLDRLGLDDPEEVDRCPEAR